MTSKLSKSLHIAPMMGYTNRHFRYLMRLIAPQSIVYTEMITTGACLFGNQATLLAFDKAESPIVCQIGGSNPQECAESVKIIESYGYSGINLNVGCPSSRVQQGSIGACLYLKPKIVQSCIEAMSDVTQLPITIKCRIGVNDLDDYKTLLNFVQMCYDSGVKCLQLHARKAILNLSPKANRLIPPLNYQYVYNIQNDMPECNIILNGGVNTLDTVISSIGKVSGFMVGRAAYQNPWLLRAFDSYISTFNNCESTDRDRFSRRDNTSERIKVVDDYLSYAESQYKLGVSSRVLLRPLANLCHSLHHAKRWRHTLNNMMQTNTIMKDKECLLQCLVNQ